MDQKVFLAGSKPRFEHELQLVSRWYQVGIKLTLSFNFMCWNFNNLLQSNLKFYNRKSILTTEKWILFWFLMIPLRYRDDRPFRTVSIRYCQHMMSKFLFYSVYKTVVIDEKPIESGFNRWFDPVFQVVSSRNFLWQKFFSKIHILREFEVGVRPGTL